MLVLAVVAAVVAIAGPGVVSIDAALGIVVAGGSGALVAIGLGVVAVAGLLAATYRPGSDVHAEPSNTARESA